MDYLVRKLMIKGNYCKIKRYPFNNIFFTSSLVRGCPVACFFTSVNGNR